MRTLPVILICFVCGFALADDTEGAGAEEFRDLQIRLVTFEQIDVTAEKAPAASAEPLDGEIEAILRDTEALEAHAADQ